VAAGSVLVKWTVPRYPVTMLPDWSTSEMVQLNGVPAMTVGVTVASTVGASAAVMTTLRRRDAPMRAVRDEANAISFLALPRTRPRVFERRGPD
jgi:hypothetical protein